MANQLPKIIIKTKSEGCRPKSEWKAMPKDVPYIGQQKKEIMVIFLRIRALRQNASTSILAVFIFCMAYNC
jgi:hypothetical protein